MHASVKDSKMIKQRGNVNNEKKEFIVLMHYLLLSNINVFPKCDFAFSTL